MSRKSGFVLDNGNGSHVPVTADCENPTVGSILAQLGIPVEGAMVRLNMADTDLECEFPDGGTISVTQGNLKAANEIAELISNFGKDSEIQDASVKAALASFEEDYNKGRAAVMKTLLNEAKVMSAGVNQSVTHAEKVLKAAELKKAQFDVAVGQMIVGNPFSMVAYKGKKRDKGYVSALCAQMGLSVPECGDPRWSFSTTKEDDGPAKEAAQ